MGGEINWTALPIVCAIFGIADPETLIRQMIAIRNFQRKESENG